jgi:ABC-2 type transport system permease protein
MSAETKDAGPRVAERPWLLVARREVMSKLTDKAFLIGTLVTVLMIVGFLGWQIVSEGGTDRYTVAAAPEAASTARTVADDVPRVDDGVEVEVRRVDSEKAGLAAVRAGEADVLLRPADNGWTLVGDDSVPGDLRVATATVIRDAALRANAEEAGTSIADLERNSALGTSLLQGDAERNALAQVLGFAMAFLFYMASLSFGYTLAGSIVEEKANRIVEIITTKIPVRQLLIGKIAGNALLAIVQTAVLLGIGVVGLSFTEYADLLPAFSAGIGWFAAFFVVGFGLIACWWAVAGALASRAEDLQSTATPLSFLMIAVFLGAFLFQGTALTVASFVPPFSCVLMPIRLLRGDAALWEPFLAIGLLVLAMAATVGVAERLYRRALLQTQGRVGLRQAWNAAE